jgi:hypothetical protein
MKEEDHCKGGTPCGSSGEITQAYQGGQGRLYREVINEKGLQGWVGVYHQAQAERHSSREKKYVQNIMEPRNMSGVNHETSTQSTSLTHSVTIKQISRPVSISVLRTYYLWGLINFFFIPTTLVLTKTLWGTVPNPTVLMGLKTHPHLHSL